MSIFKGTPKDDLLEGSPWSDLMRGRNGNDLLYGQGGDDVLFGGDGDDGLYGGEGANRLRGGDGNDVLVGEYGMDTLVGGAGDDLLIAGFGPDRMAGGQGNDIYSVDDEGDQVLEHEHGGTDEVSAWSASYRLGRNIENLSFAGSGDFHGTGNVRSNRISGGDANDVLDGRAGNDTLHGWDGNDALIGGTGDDKLDGGYGTDALTGGRGDDLVDGGIGADTVRFTGLREDYAISLLGSKVIVTDINYADGDDGTDILTRVEVLQFKDGSMPSPAPLSSVDLAAPEEGRVLTIPGIAPGDANGALVASAGDVNGDGFGDFLMVAPGADSPDGYDQGESYLVFGKATLAGIPSLDLDHLDGSNGVRLNDRGYISAAGDVNADGFGDFLVGGNLVFGKADWTGSASLDLASLDGTTGTHFYAQGPVSSAGDVNGDGFDDFIVGAPLAEYGRGESAVVFGKADWSDTPFVDLSSPDGSNGIKLLGSEGYNGFAVSSAGDVNGDGFDDLIVLAPFAYNERGLAGQSYVVFGKSSWIDTPVLDLESLDGTNGFRLSPIDAGYSNGHLVSTAGDFNGDGFDDLIIGAPYGAGDSGESYIVFGKENWATTPSVDLTALTGGIGLTLVGGKTDDESGWSVASGGDVNGDGFDDVVIGAPQLGSELGYGVSRGEAYVVYGKSDWLAQPILELASLDGANGFSVVGAGIGDGTGLSVSSAGDANGDGFADLIIGAPGADRAGGYDEGASYVVFGGDSSGGNTQAVVAATKALTSDARSAPTLSLLDVLDEETSRPTAVSGEFAQDGNCAIDGASYRAHSPQTSLLADADLALIT